MLMTDAIFCDIHKCLYTHITNVEMSLEYGRKPKTFAYGNEMRRRWCRCDEMHIGVGIVTKCRSIDVHLKGKVTKIVVNRYAEMTNEFDRQIAFGIDDIVAR